MSSESDTETPKSKVNLAAESQWTEAALQNPPKALLLHKLGLEDPFPFKPEPRTVMFVRSLVKKN